MNSRKQLTAVQEADLYRGNELIARTEAIGNLLITADLKGEKQEVCEKLAGGCPILLEMGRLFAPFKESNRVIRLHHQQVCCKYPLFCDVHLEEVKNYLK